jgi:Fur family transcriptional regulator, peroxide stress response regulator
MDTVENLARKFRAAGLKVTPQRVCILETLRDDATHPSAEEIFRRVRGRFPKISFTTVYKTLQTLRDLGEIVEININPQRSHYDPSTGGHHHAFCLNCRNLIDVDAASSIPYPFLANPGIPGFEVREIQTHFIGVCSPCRARQEEER